MIKNIGKPSGLHIFLKKLQLGKNIFRNCKERELRMRKLVKKELKMNADCMARGSAVHGLNDIRR